MTLSRKVLYSKRNDSICYYAFTNWYSHDRIPAALLYLSVCRYCLSRLTVIRHIWKLKVSSCLLSEWYSTIGPLIVSHWCFYWVYFVLYTDWTNTRVRKLLSTVPPFLQYYLSSHRFGLSTWDSTVWHLTMAAFVYGEYGCWGQVFVKIGSMYRWYTDEEKLKVENTVLYKRSGRLIGSQRRRAVGWKVQRRSW